MMSPSGSGEEERLRRAEAERDQARRLLELSELRADAARDRAAEAEAHLQLILNSRGWRLLGSARRVRRALRWALPRAPLVTSARPVTTTAPETIRFERLDSPTVSIVIPVFEQLAMTLKCLASLERNTTRGAFEVIVVDDASDEATAEELGAIEGLLMVRNEENVGFLQSCNRGASQASGRYLVFLNNDVEVTPGWLAFMLGAIESSSDVGAVGAKLVYPDGRLQEAGGIIWSDGTGWNFGRDGDPDAPEYNYLREVDYCSAAALLVRRDLFEGLGGFDTRFAPAYYEDTDLCFSLREAGYRVLYEPRSTVIHHEGVSHGTDDDFRSGHDAGKANQYVNRGIFTDKWSNSLRGHRPPGEGRGYLGGRYDDALRVLVCDHWVPAWDRDSGSLRMTWILRLLRELGCHITLFPANRARREPYTTELQSLGIEVHYGPASFREFAAERGDIYDLAILSRPGVAIETIQDVRKLHPSALVIYDTVDLHYLREARRRQLLHSSEVDVPDPVQSVEIECMERSDLVATVTEEESDLIRPYVARSRAIVLPNVHEVADRTVEPFDTRRGVLFIGSFSHDPNVDAIEYLLTEILPRVGSEIDAPVWIVGTDPPSWLLERQSPRLVVTGYVREADPYFEHARVFVSPLRYGAGMKGKNGHALALGLPMVTTSIGAEGMDLVDGEHALIRDDPDSFSAALVNLYNTRDVWERLSTNGRRIARERWSPDVMRGRLEAVLEDVRAAAGTPAAARR